MTPPDTRADRFVRELAELKIPDPAGQRAGLWLRLGGTLMVLSLVVGASAYFISHNTTDPLVQRDAFGSAHVLGEIQRYLRLAQRPVVGDRAEVKAVELVAQFCGAVADREGHRGDRTRGRPGQLTPLVVSGLRGCL